ncbi:MAG: glycosyltransferase [Planctomycetes bacterium]|nr:glycosyltransferase [Planctomycetota bacterium]
MHAAFIVSRAFEDTRRFLRAAAACPGLRLSLVKGDADVRSALGVLRAADTLWFEGAGPLLGALASAPAAAWLARARLRLADDEVERLPAPGAWRLVSEILVADPRAAARVRDALPAAGGPDVRVQAPGDVGTLVALLAVPPGDLPAEAWPAVVTRAEACRGRVRVDADAPAALIDFLAVACGLEVVTDASATPPCSVASEQDLPLVSAVVPVYNGADTVDRCLGSLRRQTYPNLEILVVDDGSTDDTRQRVAQYLDDRRVRYLYKAHSGRPETRNAGVRAAQGEFIAWLDADDEALPNRVGAQVEAARAAGGADVVHSDGFILNAEGTRLIRRRGRAFTAQELPALLMAGFASVCPILNTSAMIRRDLYDRIGLYDPAFARCQDYDFYCRCALPGDVRFVHVPVPLVKVYRAQADHGRLQTILNYYHRLARRLVEHFGEDALAGPLAQALHEPGTVAIARLLAATGQVFGAPGDHAVYADAERFLRKALALATGPAREDAEHLLDLVTRLRTRREPSPPLVSAVNETSDPQ